jgi:NAD(P)-dependent dehydrogenase (short-subunit alcohol dehydrogenase family)
MANETNRDALKGRVALVTGGARGIGRAICEALHAHGASVVVADNGAAVDGRSADPMVAAEAAKAIGERAVPFGETIATADGAARAVKLAIERFGGIDLIVNNAAILRDAFIFRQEPADWDEVIRNNLSSAFYVLRAATSVMRDQAKAGRGTGTEGDYRWGRVVTLVSTTAFYGQFGQSSYAAAKGGLISLNRIVALDMARTGVTSNVIAPFAATRMTELAKPVTPEQQAYKTNALKAHPRHVATLTAWLCSEAARAITGQLFGIRGREVILYSQPRPLARFAPKTPGDWTLESLGAAIDAECAGKYIDGTTDMELFSYEPL